jgi:hypothetical protein
MKYQLRKVFSEFENTLYRLAAFMLILLGSLGIVIFLWEYFF